MKFLIFAFLVSSLASAVQPTRVHPLMLQFKFDDLNIKPGGEIDLEIPRGFQMRPLDFVFITHKQDPRDERECRATVSGNKIIDCLPAYTSFEVKDENGEWRYWGGAGSGPYNSKFAEIRKDRGETDNLYEWIKKGHVGITTKKKSNAPLVATGFRIRSVGPDTTILQEVTIKLLPPQPEEMTEIIFSKGFVFGDFQTASGRKYPGRSAQGNYGSSLAFSKKSTPRHEAIPKNWSVEKGRLWIPLTEGKRFLFLDIAAGDMKPVPQGADPELYRGGARISVYLFKDRNAEPEILADHENIGTSGVLRVSSDRLQKSKQGEYLLIQASTHTSQLMGLRVGLDSKD